MAAISSYSWDKYYKRYKQEVKDGTWKRRGLHAYNGQLLHLTGSAVTVTEKIR